MQELKVEKLVKRYPGRDQVVAVNRVDVEVEAGEMLVNIRRRQRAEFGREFLADHGARHDEAQRLVHAAHPSRARRSAISSRLS